MGRYLQHTARAAKRPHFGYNPAAKRRKIAAHDASRGAHAAKESSSEGAKESLPLYKNCRVHNCPIHHSRLIAPYTTVEERPFQGRVPSQTRSGFSPSGRFSRHHSVMVSPSQRTQPAIGHCWKMSNPAAKRRKVAAHDASRGCPIKTRSKPQRGERNACSTSIADDRHKLQPRSGGM
jgi:hypothetical protein